MQPDRERLISLLDRGELKHAIDAFSVTVEDRRSPAKMLAAIARCTEVSAERLLSVVEPDRERELRAMLKQEPVSGTSPRPRTQRKPGPPAHLHGHFVAIDFETADTGRDSACAIAVVRVEGDRVVDRRVRLIRPPRKTFQFTYVHGIRWANVALEPIFEPVWNEVKSLLDGADFLVAHNASFDKGVLNACCANAGILPPALPFECTVKWARLTWGLRPANLPAVCQHLNLPLVHHDPASDAEACARIMIAVRKQHLAKEV